MSDRDEIYDYIKREINPYGRPFKGTAFEFGVKIMDYIKNMSDKSGWIPVSERLPEDGIYITTLDGELVGQEEPFTGMCGIENGKWDDEDCVIAWMPLPEPYKEEDQNGHEINILDIPIQKETLQMLLSDM